ncbi:uncharacterized protein LOC130453179 [Diorhabda sublineata]|uniref:uncharacterized protein LOC130453179 n=1 Tax=Diorhabda sublineata TaxID=1163346 RepID=UPI0024E08DCF|nr:uncharacterized protein LOC130453179 [Diorhabda sublineata]
MSAINSPGTSDTISDSSNTQISLIFTLSKSPQILLPTALVTVFDRFGNPHQCRVLLDSGSQVNFISEKLCNTLQLNKQQIDILVTGISQMSHNVQSSTLLKFRSNMNNLSKTISCIALPQITDLQLELAKLNIPEKITLADPNFHHPAPIDLLIGADTFWDLLSIGQIKLGKNLPTLQKTKSGWIVSGPIFTNTQRFVTHHCTLSTNILESQLTKFWEIEEVPKALYLSYEERLCEELYKNTTTIHNDGCFIVTIPLKNETSVLGDSKKHCHTPFFKFRETTK